MYAKHFWKKPKVQRKFITACTTIKFVRETIEEEQLRLELLFISFLVGCVKLRKFTTCDCCKAAACAFNTQATYKCDRSCATVTRNLNLGCI